MGARAARQILSAVGLLVALFAGVGPAAASPPSGSSAAFEDAQEMYTQGKWSAAYRRFAELGDAGDAEAARIALLMLRYGRALYGHEWGASQSQIDHWIALYLQRMTVLRVSADE